MFSGVVVGTFASVVFSSFRQTCTTIEANILKDIAYGAIRLCEVALHGFVFCAKFFDKAMELRMAQTFD